jgi:RNA polymerase sigma factor (TIGR02999 family)
MGEPGGSAPDERRVLDERFSEAYEQLRRIASSIRRSEPGAAVNTGTLVHEAWLKLKDSPRLAETSMPHFKAIAARAMRQILVDAARRRHAQKRGGAGDAIFVTMDEHADKASSHPIEVLAIDMALTRLESFDMRQAKIFECRFFSGLNVAETATALAVSESVIERDWRSAKAWMAAEMRTSGDRSNPARGVGEV